MSAPKTVGNGGVERQTPVLYLLVCRGTYEHSTCNQNALIVEPWAVLVASMKHYFAAACEAEYLEVFHGNIASDMLWKDYAGRDTF